MASARNLKVLLPTKAPTKAPIEANVSAGEGKEEYPDFCIAISVSSTAARSVTRNRFLNANSRDSRLPVPLHAGKMLSGTI